MADTMLDERRIHEGHRARMRSKLKAHGARIFDTYELLEMLLYYVVPQRDTNPLAKQLLHRFGSLDGVLRAGRNELMEVSGVGECVADFIVTMGIATDIHQGISGKARLVFDDFKKTGQYFVDYFKNNTETNIAILLLDNSMRMLAIEDIPGTNFGSGAVRARPFVDAAMRCGATVGIVAYTHRTGVAFPYSGDYETARMLRHELLNVGVTLMEQYVVGDNDFASSHLVPTFKISPSPAMQRFMETRRASE